MTPADVSQRFQKVVARDSDQVAEREHEVLDREVLIAHLDLSCLGTGERIIELE